MSNIIETSPTSRGYASRHLRKSAIKARVNNTKRPRPPPPSSPAQSSTTATTIVQKHLPTVRLGDVLHKHPNLFTNGNKRGSKIHAANKHIAHIDRLAERYTQVKILYLGGNDLTTTMGFQQFSNLATLSLSNNLLSNMSDIYVLAGACPTLRNVSLEGNDITQTPYYRERVIAAMPELEALDGKKVLDQELRDAVDVEAKYAKSMNLLFQNDCLIHKLKRVSRQISLHSDLHAVKHGLRRGSIGSKIPITLLRTIDASSSGGGRGGGAKASTDVLSIDQFLHRWRYIDTLSVEERQSIERRITVGALRFYTLLQQTQNMENQSGQKNTAISSSSSTTPTHSSSSTLWDEAFGQMLMVQQSSIAKLVDMCRATEEQAKKVVLKTARKDSKNYLKEELREEQHKQEQREVDLRSRIVQLEQSVVAAESRLVEAGNGGGGGSGGGGSGAGNGGNGRRMNMAPDDDDDAMNMSDLDQTSMSRLSSLAPPIGLNAEENVARTLAGSFDNVSRHHDDIDATFHASALHVAAATTVVHQQQHHQHHQQQHGRGRPRERETMHNVSPAPRTAPPPVPTPSTFKHILPTPHAKGVSSQIRRNRFLQHSNHGTLSASQSAQHSQGARRRKRRGPTFSVSPPPSARSPARSPAEHHHRPSPRTIVSFGTTTVATETTTNNNNNTTTTTTVAASPRRASTFPSSAHRATRATRSMSPQRLPSANTYRLIVRQLLNAVQAGR